MAILPQPWSRPLTELLEGQIPDCVRNSGYAFGTAKTEVNRRHASKHKGSACARYKPHASEQCHPRIAKGEDGEGWQTFYSIPSSQVNPMAVHSAAAAVWIHRE